MQLQHPHPHSGFRLVCTISPRIPHPHVSLALGLLQDPRSVLGVCFPVQSTQHSMGAVAAYTTGVLRTPGVRGFKSAGRCKLCCSCTQAAFRSSSWHVLWQKICLGKAIFSMGTCQQHSHAWGALRLPSCQYQRKQQAGLFSLKIKPCPVYLAVFALQID